MTVRDAEKIARKIAVDRIRKKEYLPDPELADLEDRLQETLGTRVHIDRKENGGQITIDFFSNDDLRMILDIIKSNQIKNPNEMLDSFMAKQAGESVSDTLEEDSILLDDRTTEEKAQADEDADLYSIKNFSI